MIYIMLTLLSSSLSQINVPEFAMPTVGYTQTKVSLPVPNFSLAAEEQSKEIASQKKEYQSQNILTTRSSGIVPASVYDCPDLAVPMQIMRHVINVESGRNPYAIGVVGGHLARQPRTLEEAVATADMLRNNGYNYSVGISQVNRYNFERYGLKTHHQAFDVCHNLKAGTRILRECYERSGGDWSKSFSCYYSGNFVTGFKHGYVQKVLASLRNASTTPVSIADNETKAIPVISSRTMVQKGQNQKIIAQNRNNDRLVHNNSISTSLSHRTETSMTAPDQVARSEPTRHQDDAFVF